MDIPITKVCGEWCERWRTRALRGDVFHPKRHWYTILAVASAIVCLGSAVGLYEYRVMKKTIAGEDAPAVSPLERTEETLGTVLEIYRTRATTLTSGSTVRGDIVRPNEAGASVQIPPPLEGENESENVTGVSGAVLEGVDGEVKEPGSVMVSP